jgi:acetyl-CoA carboxylase carboxyltransferase component
LCARTRQRRQAEALAGGGAEAIAKQHDKGKLTARERVELLLDDGSFVETDAFAVHRAKGFGLEDKRILGDGVITGHGTIDGRRVASSARTSPRSAARSARCSPRRSSRSWTSPPRWACRSSG